MSDKKLFHRFSLAVDQSMNTRLAELQRLSGKTKNALVVELISHSIKIAEEHYKELRILELKRLEKERNTPYNELE